MVVEASWVCAADMKPSGCGRTGEGRMRGRLLFRPNYCTKGMELKLAVPLLSGAVSNLSRCPFCSSQSQLRGCVFKVLAPALCGSMAGSGDVMTVESPVKLHSKAAYKYLASTKSPYPQKSLQDSSLSC